MSLRLRLTTLYTLLLGGVLLIFGTLVYALVSLVLLDQIDTRLSQAATQIVELLKVNSADQFDPRVVSNFQPTENLLFQVWDTDQKLQLARPAGLLNPLDQVVKAIGEDNIWEQVKRVCNVGGKQFGLVHAAGTSLLIYRKDMADKAGLKPPKTWNDLLANAKALTQSTKGDGKVDIYGITLPGDNLFINILTGELIKSNGGALFDKNNKPLLTDKKMIEVLAFWRELVKYAPPGWEGHGYLQTFQNLYGQKAAMMFQGYGRGAGLIEKFAPKEMANDKTFDVWPKPVGPSGKEPGVQVDEEPWMLFKDAKHQREAIEFLKFIASLAAAPSWQRAGLELAGP